MTGNFAATEELSKGQAEVYTYTGIPGIETS